VYISTVSTVLNIFIWTIIMIAYVRYTKASPDLHKQSRYKMPGGKSMSICIIAFYVFIFGVLFVNPETRIGVILAPLWLIVLALMYRQYKKHTAE
ncbi:gamma-aminobutyrate permease, partial [Staphylococcus gallinarum]